mgnify:CR=1 FL=1|tara:strand:- start:1005 stop:1202 length:198 start_codon:yes stop_codon:yes gene_type:complete
MEEETSYLLKGVVLGVIISSSVIVFFEEKLSDELVSNKEIKPSIKITCIEVDNSKKCDTIYTYKK